jgi:glycosyltransferase involved in cell wall biosynthesis
MAIAMFSESMFERASGIAFFGIAILFLTRHRPSDRLSPKPPLRILVDAHVFDEVHQGTRTFLKGLYTELIQLMPEVHFYFAAFGTEGLRREFGDHPNVHHVQLGRSKVFRLLFEMPFLIWRHKIDFAHFQYITPVIKNCKFIVTTHDILFNDFQNLFPLKYRVLKNFLFRLSARKADILLTVSDYSRKSISRHYKIPISEIHVVPNGVSGKFFDSGTTGNSNQIMAKYGLDKFILYVSRIEPRKNHLLLLKAFYELELWRKDYKLVFIGKRDFLFGEIDTFIAACPAEYRNKILFLQNIDEGELLLFYRNASLFVYPSLAEGFGIPPIEAISSGTPTICSNATAMSDFDFLGDDLFDPVNLEEMKMKIGRKLENPDSLSRIGDLKNIVESKYSWTESARKFALILEMNCKGSHSKAGIEEQ